MTPQQLDRLEKIAKLKESGALTQEQFEVERRKIVGLTKEEKADQRKKLDSQNNENLEKLRKILTPISPFISWFFSVCLLIAGITNWQTPTYLFGAFIAGLIILPPFDKFLKTKSIQIPFWGKVIIFFVGTSIAGSVETQQQKTEAESKVVSEEKSTKVKSKEEAEQKENKVFLSEAKIIKGDCMLPKSNPNIGNCSTVNVEYFKLTNNSDQKIKSFSLKLNIYDFDDNLICSSVNFAGTKIQSAIETVNSKRFCKGQEILPKETRIFNQTIPLRNSIDEAYKKCGETDECLDNWASKFHRKDRWFNLVGVPVYNLCKQESIKYGNKVIVEVENIEFGDSESSCN